MNNKLITVIGCTGTGKSNLAIKLAGLFNAEIINADAMQMYKGLNLTTNKIDLDKTVIKHHLMNIVTLDSEIKIHEFESLAINKVSQLLSADKLPIIVGGTNYYIQALLFKNTLINSTSNESVECRQRLEQLNTNQLFEKLKETDPMMSNYWHPKDRRKIIRSLEVFETTGKKHSELMLQKIASETTKKRYDNNLVIWIHCKLELLEKIIDERVDEMIKNGLISELEQFCLELIKTLKTKEIFDHEYGLRQAIGFRALKEYLKNYVENNERNEELRRKGIEMLRIHTKQYAKKQMRWIKNKLIPLCNENRINVHVVDISDHNVEMFDKTKHIVEKFLKEDLDEKDLTPKNKELQDILRRA